MRTRLLVLVAAAVAVAALSPGRALAHALDVTVKVPPDSRQVVVEVGFDDGTPAEKAEVVVTDASGAVVAKGLTDGDGGRDSDATGEPCRFGRPFLRGGCRASPHRQAAK